MTACQLDLIPEGDRAGLRIHSVHDCRRFHMITQIANRTAAILEALLDHDTAAFHDVSCNMDTACGGMGQGVGDSAAVTNDIQAGVAAF